MERPVRSEIWRVLIHQPAALPNRKRLNHRIHARSLVVPIIHGWRPPASRSSAREERARGRIERGAEDGRGAVREAVVPTRVHANFNWF